MIFTYFAAAVTGIGSDYIIGVNIDNGARIDLTDLRAKLQRSLDEIIPVYAVAVIVGSTEEGAVDPLRGILKLRAEFQSKGLSFLVHGDGAWVRQNSHGCWSCAEIIATLTLACKIRSNTD